LAKSKQPIRRKSKPLPSLIAPKTTWQIRESRGKAQTNLTDGTIQVPLGVTGEERAIRNQQMAKVKFSPKRVAKGAGIDPNAMEACENLRAFHRASIEGVDVGRWMDFLTDDEIDTVVKDSQLSAATALVEAHYFNDRYRIEQAINASYPSREAGMIKTVARTATYMATGQFRKRPGPKMATNAAKYLTEILGDPPEPPEANKNNDTSNKPDAAPQPSEVRQAMQEIAQRADFSEMEKEEKEIAEKQENGEGQGSKPPDLMTDQGHDRTWCRMTITEPKRTVRFPSKMRGRSWKATDQGVVLRYPQRYCADKTMFAAKAQKPRGCTVDIDASGSMNFTIQEILRIMQLMPAAVIAAYNGGRTHGELRILAKKGRRVEEAFMKPPHGGNGVDGPALDWLAKQPGPRYWVSDGHVFGYEGKRTPAMLAAVYKHCRDHHILRVDSLTEVIERFQ
jgi:hypothetical protein